MGKAIIISAPSGSGKTTIAKELLSRVNSLQFSISACTRKPRQGVEQDGVDYYFMTTEEFIRKTEAEEFIEWEEVYSNMLYGTLKSEVDRIWKTGKHILFDVDVKGGISLKKYFGNKALAIFIKAPSMEEIEKRLGARQTEDPETMKLRLDKVRLELNFENQFDTTIVNSNLESAVDETVDKVQNFLSE